MKKTLVMLTALLAALPLAALNIDSREIDGFPIILPEVKECRRTGDSFPIPATLTVAAPAGLDLDGLAATFAEARKGKLERAAEGAAAVLFALGSGEELPRHPEGYTLDVNRRGVTIRAREVRGLRCGMQTLRWMLRNTRGDLLKGCRISDWPDLDGRGILLELQSLRPAEVPKLCRIIDLYGQLKYNRLLIDFSANFPLSGNPLSLRKNALSAEDIRRIKAACDAAGIEIQPSLQVVTHAYWMTFHPDFHTKFSEGKASNPWNSGYCLSRPEPEALVLQYLREAVDLLQPKHFSFASDEIFCIPFRKCDACKKVEPVKLFGEHVKRLMDYLASRGVTVHISHDQFEPNSPTCPASPIVDAVKLFDRGTAIALWDYHACPNPNIQNHFTDLGFKQGTYMSYTWEIANVITLAVVAKRNNALSCWVSTWHALAATLEEKIRADIFAGIVFGATDSWNVTGRSPAMRPYDPTLELKMLRKPDAIVDYETRKGMPIPIDRALNCRLGSNVFFPQFDAAETAALKAELAARPERFRLVTDRENYFGIVLTGGRKDNFPAGPVTIPVETKAEGFSFLLASAPFNEALNLNRRKEPTVATLTVDYEEGDPVTVKLNHTRHIMPWNADYGAWEARIVNRFVDKRGIAGNFYVFGWRNPRPGATVKSFTFSTAKGDGLIPAILAVSAFGAETPGVKPQSDAEIAAALRTSPPDPTVTWTPVLDLEKRRLRGITHGGDISDSAIRYRVRNDEATGEKMITVEMPPITGMRHWSRSTIDIPLGVPGEGKIKAIRFRYRFSQPEAIWFAGVYLSNPGGGSNVNWSINHRILDRGFYTYQCPVDLLRGKENGGVKFDKKTTLRLSFIVCNTTPMTIDIKDIATAPETDVPWMEISRPCVYRQLPPLQKRTE